MKRFALLVPFLFIASLASAQVVIIPPSSGGSGGGSITGGVCDPATFVTQITTAGVITCSTGGTTTIALDNLASVNINTSLLAQTGVNLGSAAKPFKDLFLWGGGTFGSTSVRLTATPTGNRVITFFDSTDTVLGRATTDTVSNKTFVAPVLGAATATSINKLAITQPANGATFVVPDGVTATWPSSSSTAAVLSLTNIFTGRQDASGAASTAPVKKGTVLPATCVVGDLFFKTDATAGQQLYECDSTDHWTQQLNTGGAGGDFSSSVSSSVDGELVLYSGSLGKTAKRATGTGWPVITAGVFGTFTPGAGVQTWATTPSVANFGTALGSQSANTILAAPCGSSGTVTARVACASDFPTTIAETIFSSNQTISAWGSSYRIHAAANLNYNLPTVAGNTDATMAFCINRDSAGLVTLDANGSQTIDGALTRVLRAGDCRELKVDDDGEITKIGGIIAPFSATATRQLTDSATLVAGPNIVPLDTLADGDSAMWDAANARLKTLRAGKYDIDLSCVIKGLSTSDSANVAIIVNGTTTYGGNTVYNSPAGAFGFGTATAKSVSLSVNDYIQVYVYVVVGGLGTEAANGDTSSPVRLTVTEVRPW